MRATFPLVISLACTVAVVQSRGWLGPQGASSLPLLQLPFPKVGRIVERATPKGQPYSGEGPAKDSKNQSVVLSNLAQQNAEAEQKRTLSNFQTRDSRIGFIRKVYAIFLSQLGMTIATSAFMMTTPAMAEFVLSTAGAWVFGASVATSFVAQLSLLLRDSLRKTSPQNFVTLGLFTLAQSYVVGCVTITFDAKVVILAALQSLVALGGITAYAFQKNPKYDLTLMGSTLLSAFLLMLSTVFISLFYNPPWFDLLISAFGALLFSSFIALDTALIVGGKNNKFKIDPSEPILAAMALYVDVLNLFLHLLRIMAALLKEN